MTTYDVYDVEAMAAEIKRMRAEKDAALNAVRSIRDERMMVANKEPTTIRCRGCGASFVNAKPYKVNVGLHCLAVHLLRDQHCLRTHFPNWMTDGTIKNLTRLAHEADRTGS